MSKPAFRVTPEGIAAFSEMFGIELPVDEVVMMTDHVSGLLDDIQLLWEVDVSGHEMAVIFPVEH